jgi:hypothetical protein
MLGYGLIRFQFKGNIAYTHFTAAYMGDREKYFGDTGSSQVRNEGYKKGQLENCPQSI